MKISIGLYSHSLNKRIRDVNAVDLVDMAVSNAPGHGDGTIEALNAKVEKLSSIVGRMLEKLPESEWLEVVQIYGVEQA